MFKSIVYSLVTKGTVAAINFIILLVSSRYLGVSSRGEISIFLLNITIIQIINEVYTGYGIVHFIPKYNFTKILAGGLIYTLIFCSLGNFFLSSLARHVQGYEWLGYLVTLVVILNTFNCVLILGSENIRAYNFLSFIQPLLLLLGVFTYIFVFKKYTFDAYVYPLLFSFIAAFGISTVTLFPFLRKKDLKSDFKLKPILINGFIFQSAGLMYVFVNRYSYYLLPDIANVGLYSSASSLMEALLIIVNGIAPVLLARVSHAGNTEKSTSITLVLSKASFFFSVISVSVLLLIPESFFVYVLGDGFKGIRNLMLLYSPGVVLVSLFGSMSYYFSAIGKQRLVLLCYSLGFISTLILAPVLIAYYGNAGAAFNANFSYLLMGIAICSAFIITNKLSVKRFFSLKEDYDQFKQLIFSPELFR